MTRENLLKNVKIFSGKVKAASNIATIFFLAALGYTISLWQKVSGFDNFINVLIALMMLIINFRFYRIHLNLSSINELAEDSRIRARLRHQKKEYSQLVVTSLVIIAVLILLKLLLA